MKAISIQFPWWWPVFHAWPHLKNVENRKWRTKHRGRLLIHASKTDDILGHLALEQLGFVAPYHPVRGCIVGSVNLDEIVPSDSESVRDNPWAADHGWCWMFSDPKAFGKPIPFRGWPGLFDVPDELVGEACGE